MAKISSAGSLKVSKFTKKFLDHLTDMALSIGESLGKNLRPYIERYESPDDSSGSKHVKTKKVMKIAKTTVKSIIDVYEELIDAA